MTGNTKPLTPSSALFDNTSRNSNLNMTTTASNAHMNPPSYNTTMRLDSSGSSKNSTYSAANNDNTTTTTAHHYNTDNTVTVQVQSIDSNNNTTTTNNTTLDNTNEGNAVIHNTSVPSTQTASLSQNSFTSSSPHSDITNSSRRFSFNKRPISKTNSKVQRKSSQISIINNYPPQRCDSVDHDIDHTKFYSKYKGIMKDKDELPDAIINDLNFEYNYDNKIRAPRMSSATFLSSNDLKDLSTTTNSNHPATTHNNKLTRQISAPSLLKRNSVSSSNHTLDSLVEEDPNSTQKGTTTTASKSNSHYQPATYDLTKQLRRFSISEEKLDDTTANAPQPPATTNRNIFSDSTGNYVYRIESRKKSIISNSSSNISPTKDRFLRFENDDLKPIKQIDEPLKLLNNYVPPVLRPIQDSTFKFHEKYFQPRISAPPPNNTNSSTSSTDSDDSLLKQQKNQLTESTTTSTTPPTEIPENLQAKPKNMQNVSKIHSQLLNQLSTQQQQVNKNNEYGNFQPLNLETPPTTASSNNSNLKKNNKNIEPSHSNWKPNNSTNSCENCHDNFNLIRRKHHCRHCGGIFCSRCLQQYSNLNLLAHFERPDDINFSTHHLISSALSPIKSTETTETCTTINSAFTYNSQNTNNTKKSKASGYSKFCKVCPDCYGEWLKFLASDEDYEGKISDHSSDLLDNKLESQRKESITGVPSDWNWSSF